LIFPQTAGSLALMNLDRLYNFNDYSEIQTTQKIAFIMLFIDAIFYLLIYLYCDEVQKHEYYL